jgi:hypothetical protein
MFETYRMLGRDREDELLREARRLQVLGPLRLRLVVIAALTLLAAATFLVANANASPVVIPFEKHWVGPGHYVGTACDGGSLEVWVSNSSIVGNVQHFTATFEVLLPGNRAFTAVLEGIFNFSTGRTLLNGSVTRGWFAGAQAHEEGQLTGVDPLVFTGSLTLIGASD